MLGSTHSGAYHTHNAIQLYSWQYDLAVKRMVWGKECWGSRKKLSSHQNQDVKITKTEHAANTRESRTSRKVQWDLGQSWQDMLHKFKFHLNKLHAPRKTLRLNLRIWQYWKLCYPAAVRDAGWTSTIHIHTTAQNRSLPQIRMTWSLGKLWQVFVMK